MNWWHTRRDDVNNAILRSLHCSANRAHTQFTGHRIGRVHCARAFLSAFTFAQLLRSSPSRRPLRSYCIYFVVRSSNFSPHVSLKSKRSTAELQVSYRHSMLLLLNSGRQFIIAPSDRCQIDQICSNTTCIIAMNITFLSFLVLGSEVVLSGSWGIQVRTPESDRQSKSYCIGMP